MRVRSPRRNIRVRSPRRNIRVRGCAVTHAVPDLSRAGGRGGEVTWGVDVGEREARLRSTS
eukprot:3901319-Rhodomonas_salina.2